MRGILVIENMNLIKKRIGRDGKLSIYVNDKFKICNATGSIIDIALFQIGHFMAFIRYLFDTYLMQTTPYLFSWSITY